MDERGRERLALMLKGSAEAVRNAVRGRVLAGRDMDPHYDHPVLTLPLLWHEGYHHGQIELALKVSSYPKSDEEAGPLTWDGWRKRER